MSNASAWAGRALMVGLSGPVLGEQEAARVRRLGPAGAILFARNLQTPEQLVTLVRDLADCLPGPTLLAIDQEGGRVSRLQPWIGETPTAARLTELGTEATGRFARLTGDALHSLGFNLDFAPVVDLCEPSMPNGIGDRSFGVDPERAATYAQAFLRGLDAAGVAGCLKHFPGLGDTSVDSHETLPTCDRPRAELEGLDLDPYRRLAPLAPSVMIGHAHYTAWHPDTPEPATGSATIVTGLLRETLGFGGVVVSDDLEMGAVVNLDENGAFAVRAMKAGCDLLLYCHDLERAERARDAMVTHAQRDPAFLARLESAAAANERLARRFPLPVPDLAGWKRALDALVDFRS